MVFFRTHMCGGKTHVVCGREVREDKEFREIKEREGKKKKEREKKSSESAREFLVRVVQMWR